MAVPVSTEFFSLEKEKALSRGVGQGCVSFFDFSGSVAISSIFQ
jgi:hypothetical protein